MSAILFDYFNDVSDPRVERTKLHDLENILTIAICATICGDEATSLGRDSLSRMLLAENLIPRQGDLSDS